MAKALHLGHITNKRFSFGFLRCAEYIIMTIGNGFVWASRACVQVTHNGCRMLWKQPWSTGITYNVVPICMPCDINMYS